MNRFISSFVNLLFPELCIICRIPTSNHLCNPCLLELINTSSHSRECVKCKSKILLENLCATCREEVGLDELYISLNYQGKHVHTLIHAFKYQNIQSLAQPLAQIILSTLPITLSSENTLLTYIPMHSHKLALRGYNQGQLLSSNLSTLTQIPALNLLEKIRNTSTQTILTREQRVLNIKKSFKLSTDIQPHIQTIYLVDDVTTTLSTLQEAVKVIKQHTDAKIIGIVLAHNESTSQ
jgi:competence protein ComFC